jgi:AmmeMemoRadiSam system protein B
MIRKPAVAGVFYEGNHDSLKKQIEWCFEHKLGPGKIPSIGNKREIKGLMVPHAGYMYSGPVAAHSYYKLAEDGFPETFVILSPNHRGLGSAISTMLEGEWETPLGNIEIDTKFARKLMEDTGIIDHDPSSHVQEHSLEVQIPFLQYFSEDFKIVPVSMWMQDIETSYDLGKSIKNIAEALQKDIVVIASSDMTHDMPQNIANQNDSYVLDAIKAMDEKLMIKRIMERNVTMCGYGPVTSTIIASKGLGAQEAQILKYATSGDITGNLNAVVGYAAAMFW